MKNLKIGLVLFVFLNISACGMKGPLYLPQDNRIAHPVNSHSSQSTKVINSHAGVYSNNSQ